VHLNSIDDPQQVFEEAQKLKRIFDWFSFLIHENKKKYIPITLWTLFNQKDQIVTFDTRELSSYIPTNLLIDTGTQSHTSWDEIIKLCERNPKILNLITILGQWMDYRDLYQAYDIIQKEITHENRNILNEFNNDLSRFTHTANNFQTSWVQSRHGHEIHAAPQNPINLKDSQKLISDIIKKVLLEIYGINIPLIKDYTFNTEDIF
jgi:hypothetical protein